MRRSGLMLLRGVLMLCLVACGGTASGTGTSNAGESSTANAGGSVGATSTMPAPASFDACRTLSIDCEGTGPPPACAFPEGTCTCEIHYRCSGVPPEPGERNAWREWTCRETPPAFRSDGCPGTEPSDGAPCDGRAAFCSYGDCDFVPYECVGGVWVRGMPSAPPAAMP